MLLGIGQGFFNLFSQGSTNRTNLQIARETNQANAEQANLAYMRSLPANQVSNLMAAGMSKPAAIASLSGGGTYSAPVMQAGHVDVPQLDMSAALERLQNMPSNVEQRKLIQAQRNDLEVSTRLKENQDKRAAELHEYEIWQRMYGKESTQKLDSATNTILNALLDSGKDASSFKSFEDMLRGLGLQNDKSVRNLPSVARSQVYSSVRDRFAESREQREQTNRDEASRDAHDLAELRKSIERVNVKYYEKEKHEQLLNLMRVGEGLIQDNNNKFEDWSAKEMENFVRAAGINDEAQARALGEYVNRLSNEDEYPIHPH